MILPTEGLVDNEEIEAALLVIKCKFNDEVVFILEM